MTGTGLRIDFVGINLSNPDQVSYQYKLDGYEEEWSDVSNDSLCLLRQGGRWKL